ncbi:MAG: response regulator [Gammaproteobacteria bacterium]|jgi:PAS domain S-box-containing protein
MITSTDNELNEVIFTDNVIAILDAITDPTFITDQTGKIILANTLTEKLFNCSKKELLDMHVEDLMPERFRAQHIAHRQQYLTNPFTKSMSTGGATTLNYYCLTKDNKEFPIDISLSTLDLNKQLFILVRMQNLTERQLYEKSLQEIAIESTKQIALTAATEQFNKQQEQFIGALEHEFNNPLNGAYGGVLALQESLESLKLAQEESKPIESIIQQATEESQIITKCIKQQKIILKNLIMLSQLENNKIGLTTSHFELTELITNIFQSFTLQINQKNLNLTLKLPSNPVWIKTDPDQLSQVITNLVSNAIKFTEQGCIIFMADADPTLDHYSGETKIYFIIKDTGMGMLPNEITNLFSQFINVNNRTGTQYNGSGLSLSVSKKIIELMGGTIQIESEKWQGSTFSFSIKCSYLSEQEILDAIQTKKLLHTKKTSLQIPNLSGKKILIVEDNQINTTILLKQLNQTNCECYTAADGKQALEQCEQTHFNLIFMDIEMPELNGFETTKQIREQELSLNYDTTIIGISGYTSQAIKELAMQSGMNDYLTKPYEPKELFDAIIKHLLTTDECSIHIAHEQYNEILCSPTLTQYSTRQSASFTPQSSHSDVSKLGDKTDKPLLNQLHKEHKKKLNRFSATSSASNHEIKSLEFTRTSINNNKKCIIL